MSIMPAKPVNPLDQKRNLKFVDEIKTKASIESDLQILKEWLSKTAHLPKDIGENLLTAFYYGTNSIEMAKKKIDAFCTARSKFPESFGFPFRDPLNYEFKESCKYTNMFFLPETTGEGYRVLMICGYEPDKFKNNLFNAWLLMMLELALELWPSMPGLVVVIDGKGSNMSIVPKLNIVHNILDAQYFQHAMPVKPKRIVIFNATPVVDFIVNGVIKRVFSKKIYDRYDVVPEDEKILEKYFPLELLPKDYYGGAALPSSELNEQWRLMLEEKREWFLETSKLCSDETKRPPDVENSFGVDGTFKYLAID